MGDDGITLPGSNNLPTGDQAEASTIDFILGHPQMVAAVILAIVALVFVKKYPVLSAIIGAALVTAFLMKVAG